MLNKVRQLLHIGLDAGSTTVKAVVVDDEKNILWQNYIRHLGKQRKVADELMADISRRFPDQDYRIYCTGSGGTNLAKILNGEFFQEVSAVSEAVINRYPNTGSVIELGGQDAKMIIYPQGDDNQQQKFFSMNDKCAGGTGAVIDKISAKLSLNSEQLSNMPYDGITIHPVAAKCGVFAETDINGLQKSGIEEEQLFASLLDAIVLQNLSVLARGNTVKPDVVLLGGPHNFLPGLVQAWRHHISLLWNKRDVKLPQNKTINELIHVPENALYFAALGAIDLGINKAQKLAKISMIPSVFIDEGKQHLRTRSSGKGLFAKGENQDDFIKQYQVPSFHEIDIKRGTTVSAFLGIDCGSTSTKVALLDEHGEIIELCYNISADNPIQDTKNVLNELLHKVDERGINLDIKSVVTTGYAKDMLKDVIGADISVVETIAHTRAAIHYYDDVDVICDVGGQDIKLIFLKDGQITDFRLNTQCSAGNGYFLQNTAATFGVDIKDYSKLAFTAQQYPDFSYGCSVFLQSDIIDFQRQGWEVEEILAGLAAILPSNIWLYVASMPNLTSLGSTFLLQGGTQRNLAAVKSQVDFINERFNKANKEATIHVHKYCAESGAIGAALEGIKQYQNEATTQFIGFDEIAKLKYKITNDERTICGLCSKDCRRSFIDVPSINVRDASDTSRLDSIVPLAEGHIRVITGNHCEKGLTENRGEIKQYNQHIKQTNLKYPNLADQSAKEVWRFRPTITQANAARHSIFRRFGSAIVRTNIRIGIPRVLNMYSLMPFFRGYFEALGIKKYTFSKFTDEELYKKGASRLSIDPCFPSKLAVAHVQDLLTQKLVKKPDFIFFPMINTLPSELQNTVGSYACPTITMTPEAVKAALTKERDIFNEKHIQYFDPILDMATPELLERQLYNCFKQRLGLRKSENHQAVRVGLETLKRYKTDLHDKGQAVIDQLVKNKQIALVVLGRTYHNDPGVNHGILEQLQQLGYPILTQDILPINHEHTRAVFHDSERHAMSVDDVWHNSYSENTNQKIWAAKYTARHPNLVAIELSNFNCGHDAPIYSLITRIIESSKTPYFCFKDLDENKPSGSIKIRLETINYFLKHYQQQLQSDELPTNA